MSRLRTILKSLINSVKFWRDKEVPGVADQVRKTQLKQDQKSRQSEMSELLKMVQEGKVVCIDGTEIELTAETICVHGDNPAALELVRNIRDALLKEEIEIAPPATFL